MTAHLGSPRDAYLAGLADARAEGAGQATWSDGYQHGATSVLELLADELERDGQPETAAYVRKYAEDVGAVAPPPP